MTDFDAIIYTVITSATDVMTLVGTYTDGANTIKKVFPFAAPLREGSKVNPPLVVFNKAVSRDITSRNAPCIYVLDVLVTIIHTNYDGATSIAGELMDYIVENNTFTVSGTPVRAVFEKMDYAQQIEGFDPIICAIDMNFTFRINL